MVAVPCDPKIYYISENILYIYEEVKTKMESKADTLIGLVVGVPILLFAVFIGAPAIVDMLGSKTDNIPADSPWNSAENPDIVTGADLLKTLGLPVVAAIVVFFGVCVLVLLKSDIGGGM